VQVGQVILSMPSSYSQMGYKWGLIFHFLYVTIGVYTCYLLARLYVEYRNRKEKEGVEFKKHVIQVTIWTKANNSTTSHPSTIH
jgi:auxin influx carrier (AUX1 LAX family)